MLGKEDTEEVKNVLFTNLSRKKEFAEEIISTIDDLESWLKRYFPSLSDDEYECIMNPFVICKAPNLTTTEKEQVIDLRRKSFIVKHSSNFGLLWKICTLKSVRNQIKFFCLLRRHGSVNLDFQHWQNSRPKCKEDF